MILKAEIDRGHKRVIIVHVHERETFSRAFIDSNCDEIIQLSISPDQQTKIRDYLIRAANKLPWTKASHL